ncbi:hypothetical protein L198_01059 [Cryptococcus wingfieldii CBS 7118]|uniref:Uncharacterized protein n=1 Tax=Cryptococcus wingfieldii CBS 7118 TaxID=1295528 RepID=A0A1E3K2X0_9TREE|nr:hypothetical protein L198_01059 [Cryptococcus wingfieldii CBS 7118]ODO07480.1 hypothetical protein L198_01059 [Cryptococcus wingfieldii CBS 7118]
MSYHESDSRSPPSTSPADQSHEDNRSTLSFLFERTSLNDSDDISHPANYNPNQRTPYPRRRESGADSPTWAGGEPDETIWMSYTAEGEPFVQVTSVGSSLRSPPDADPQSSPEEEAVHIHLKPVSEPDQVDNGQSVKPDPKRPALSRQSRLSQRYVSTLASMGYTYSPGQGTSPTPGSSAASIRSNGRGREVEYQSTPNGAILDDPSDSEVLRNLWGEERSRGTGGPAQILHSCVIPDVTSLVTVFI